MKNAILIGIFLSILFALTQNGPGPVIQQNLKDEIMTDEIFDKLEAQNEVLDRIEANQD